MFKCIIAGGRDYNDYGQLKWQCAHVLQNKHPNIEIVSGTARGADKLGERFAEENGYRIKRFPANWDKFGRGAGHIRNKEMAQYAGALILLWDGVSKGSEGMLRLAEKYELLIRVVRY